MATKPKEKPATAAKAGSKTAAAAPAAKKAAAATSKESKSPAKPALNPTAKSAAKPPAKPAAKTVVKAVATQETPPETVKAQKWHEIRTILEKIKEDTLREISKSVKNGTDANATNEPGGDIYDQASSERDRELGLLLGDREREKLHNIDEALLRIDEGEYGICEECEEEIPLGRLKAMPFARHCVKCKSDIEKLQAQTKRFEEERAYREIPLGAEEEDV